MVAASAALVLLGAIAVATGATVDARRVAEGGVGVGSMPSSGVGAEAMSGGESLPSISLGVVLLAELLQDQERAGAHESVRRRNLEVITGLDDDSVG